MKKLLSLSVLIAILWGCCSVEDSPQTEKKETPVTYKVVFDANGGSGEMADMIFTYDVEQALTANAFTREDYTFAGWAVKAGGDVTYADEQKVSNLTAEDKATVTLYAVWNENDKVLPVIFSVASETAVDCGDSVTLSCATEGAKISYTIDGVTAEYTDAIVITKDVTITAFATKDGMKDSDTTTASYTVKTYTVTYKSDYGTVSVQINGLKKGDTLTEVQLTGVTTTGYTFAGWYNGESEVTTEYKIICDLELSAKWTANTYTVKFNANGGIGNMEYQAFTYNAEQALNANSFTREGYTFAGWAASDDGKVIYADKGKVKNLTAENNAIVTLYAVWNEKDKVLPVIFSVPSETAVDCGDSVTLSCDTEGAKISYTIDGVTAEYTDAIVITKDVTITAFATKDGMKDGDTTTVSYTVKTYTVTYTTEYGVAPSKIDGLKKDDKLTAEELPKLTTDGYTFAGWYNGENEVTTEYKISSDLNLTAKWNANTDTAYTVEHYQQNIIDDEYILAETDTETGTTDEDTSATAKDYAGFTAKTIEQMKIAANGSTVVKIYYDRKEITLTLNLNGGEGKTEITGKYGADVTTPANPTKIGYTFAGWNSDLPAAFPAENATYTAQWTANNYTVKFDFNGGNGTMTDQVFTYDMEQALTANVFTLDGYTFAGWATTADGDIVYIDGQKVLNLTSENNAIMTFYAVWEIENYTITYELNGGKNVQRNPNSYTVETDTITLANATRTGYVFLGWYIDNTFTNPITKIVKGSTENIILYAKWKASGEVGDIAYSDGSVSAYYDSAKKPVGIVIEVTNNVVTKIVSLKEVECEWCEKKITTYTDSEIDGMKNLVVIQNIDGWEEKYPAFKWCDDYTDESGNSDWYLPAKDELKQLCKVKQYVNAAIDKIIAGGDSATNIDINGYYWSSSECNFEDSWTYRFTSGGGAMAVSKVTTHSVRAVRAF